MELLEKEFIGSGEVKGKKFKQIARIDDFCIYKVDDNYFEVIKVRKQEENTSIIAGKEIHFKAKEFYPKAEQWENEKTFKTLDRAMLYFNELIKN